MAFSAALGAEMLMRKASEKPSTTLAPRYSVKELCLSKLNQRVDRERFASGYFPAIAPYSNSQVRPLSKEKIAVVGYSLNLAFNSRCNLSILRVGWFNKSDEGASAIAASIL
jgi:hypothetical protein